MAKFVKIKNTETDETKHLYAPDAKEWCAPVKDRKTGKKHPSPWVPASTADRKDLERKPPILTPEQLEIARVEAESGDNEPPIPTSLPEATRGGKKDGGGDLPS